MTYRTIRNFCIVVLVIAGATALVVASGLAGPSASGHGTLIVPNGSAGNNVRRQFTFSAREMSDGTVTGNAILHNPAFTGDGTQQYMLHIDISCMNVYGNIVFFGGTTRRTNDPNLVDAVFFSVEDNGNPGAGNDKISSVFFWDEDPTTTGDPGACENNQVGDFPMTEIESGNISVR
jgi:hypothetical protein